jgi:hypothetical protein
MAKLPPINPPDYPTPGRGGAPIPGSPGSVPFAPGGSLGGGSVVIPLIGGAVGVLVGMHPAAIGGHTPATQHLFRQAAKSSGRRGGKRSARKRRAAKRSAPLGSRRRTRAVSRGNTRRARMVKGSAAAKRHMAKLRRMRKRK